MLLNFGYSTAVKVDRYFDKIIRQLAVNPKMYPLFNKERNIRKCVISRQTSLYYRIRGDKVELIRFRGNLMNPDVVRF